MSDPLSPADLANSYRVRAGRYAVSGLYTGGFYGFKGVVRLMAALRERYRWLARNLHTAGWSGADTTMKLGYMMNCPPFGSPLSGGKVLRPCHKYLVCPFCYVRHYVYDAYDRLAPLLTGDKSLVVVTATRIARLDDGLPVAVGKCRELIRSAERSREADALGAREPGGAAMVFHRVRARRLRDTWRQLEVVRTTLAVVPRGRTVSVPCGAGVTAKTVEEPTPKTLATALAAAYAYPAEWYEMPADGLVTILTALRRTRVSAAYGLCRRPSGRPRKPRAAKTKTADAQ